MTDQPEAAASPAGDRVTVRRRAARGNYDRSVLNAILDQALVCHVGFVQAAQPYVIPTIHARDGDLLYLHGHGKNRMLSVLASGEPICVEATIIDAVVFGRSEFENSLNYRSVVVLGRGRLVESPDEKLHAMQTLVRRFLPPERVAEVRSLAASEVNSTLVIAVPLDEASSKIRSGGMRDKQQDLANPIWAGELPLRMTVGEPVPDEFVPPNTPVPAYAAAWTERWAADGITH